MTYVVDKLWNSSFCPVTTGIAQLFSVCFPITIWIFSTKFPCPFLEIWKGNSEDYSNISGLMYLVLISLLHKNSLLKMWTYLSSFLEVFTERITIASSR